MPNTSRKPGRQGTQGFLGETLEPGRWGEQGKKRTPERVGRSGVGDFKRSGGDQMPRYVWTMESMRLTWPAVNLFMQESSL